MERKEDAVERAREILEGEERRLAAELEELHDHERRLQIRLSEVHQMLRRPVRHPGSRQIRRGRRKQMVLDALADGPKTMAEVRQAILERDPSVNGHAVDAALSRMTGLGQVRREAGVYSLLEEGD